MSGKDRIYRNPGEQLGDFAFDREVAAVFPDMIRRSVPAYEALVPLTGLLAARHLAGARLSPILKAGDSGSRAGTAAPKRGSDHRDQQGATMGGGLVFDLGCSLGASTLALLRQLGDRPCRIVAVDKSKPMLDRAVALVNDDRVEFRLEDLRETDVSGADVILMNYVLQFIRPAERPALVQRFREQMTPGGLLVVSEKIRFAAAQDGAFFDAAHLAFKRANGYSELEVSGKRTALEKVMIVDTEEAHLARLKSAGFTPVKTWFRCLNWASFLAWS
ncbi:MAG: methyltransferase domain-containing protein [Gammaproteobacteria bacterium]|nr:methyltransferase domain-containing protein [Gammaproteobacteria bacterium]MDE0368305.1 methyltransferase domain-containing protein [Gammaproteobacteria bacterium]